MDTDDVWASPFVRSATGGELIETVTGARYRPTAEETALLVACAQPRPLASLPERDRERARMLVDRLVMLDAAAHDAIGSATLSSLDLEVAGACNAECIFCPRDELKAGRGVGIMRPETFDGLLATLGPFIKMVGFAGIGEPTLNKHLPSFVRAFGERGVATALVTNGSMLDDELVDALLAGGLGSIQVSFNGNDPAAYEDHMVGLQFASTRARVERMIERVARKISVYISAIETTRNAGKLAGFVEHWRARGVEAAVFQAHSRGGTVVELVRPKRAALPASVRCGLFNTRAFVSWDGRVLACCHDIDGATELGTIGETSADRLIAAKLAVMGHRAWFPVCAGCDEPARLATAKPAAIRALGRSVR